MLRHMRIAACVGWTATLICGTCFALAAKADAGTLVRSAAPDWPQWRGPRRDGISDETGLLPSWPAGGPKRLWTASKIGNGYSSPIVVGKTLYITGDQDDDVIITAFSTDGSFRWRSVNGAAWQGSHPGARSSCTYDDGKVYHMNAHGRVACLDAVTGREVWAHPVVCQGRLFLRYHDTLYCYDVRR